MPPIFNSTTPPLIKALANGHTDHIDSMLENLDWNEKIPFILQSLHSTTAHKGTPIEFVMTLLSQNAPISSQESHSWRESLKALLRNKEAFVDSKSMHLVIRMLEHRQLPPEDVLDVLKTLNTSFVNWNSPLVDWQKDTYMEIIAHHLPGAIQHLKNGLLFLRKWGMPEEDLRKPHVLEWKTSSDGWQPWLAWHPLKLNGDRVLFQVVERKFSGYSQDKFGLEEEYQYRPVVPLYQQKLPRLQEQQQNTSTTQIEEHSGLYKQNPPGFKL